jgi:hypothetical protein
VIKSSVKLDDSAIRHALSRALPAAAAEFARQWPAEITRQQLVDTGNLRDGLTVGGGDFSITLQFPIYGAYQFFGYTTKSGATKQGRNVPDIIISSKKPLQAAVGVFEVLR